MERIPLDFYETPQKLTDILLRNQPAIRGDILECCAGEGAIAYHLVQQGFLVQQSDIKNGNCYDAASFEYWNNIAQPADWIVTNPPFSQAPIILSYSLKHAQTGVAMLLRLSFLEPCSNRSSLLKQYANNLVQVIPVNPRPKFRTDTKGSDNVTVAWFVWNKNFSWKELGIKCPFKFENWKR